MKVSEFIQHCGKEKIKLYNNKKSENEIDGSNCRCDFCKHLDFNKVDVKQILNQYEITIGNTYGGHENLFKYCPLCGRKL